MDWKEGVLLAFQQIRAQKLKSFFAVLGVRPVIGRWFTPQEDQVGAGPVALISGGFWQRKFASSPDVLGKALTLSDTAYTHRRCGSLQFLLQRKQLRAERRRRIRSDRPVE